MKLLKKIPFFLLLLVLFFCLHGSLENYGFVEFNEVLMIGFVMLICIGLFFGLLFLVFRNYLLASLITFFISFWYILFGAFHDWMKNLTSHSFFSSYSFLIPLLLVLTGLLIIVLKRYKPLSHKLVLYLNILLLIYCLVDSALIVVKYFAPKKIKTNTVEFDYKKVKAKPNVYYLLFDEYPGYKSLKDSFGFANDSLYSFLLRKQFKVIPIFSNYNYTPFSMSSILNMNYVDSGYNPKRLTQKDVQLRIDEIRNAEVFNIFKQMGYQIENFSIFDIGKNPSIANQNSFLPVHSLLLTDKILHNRVIRTSGWLFKTGKLALPFWRKKYLFQHEKNNLTTQKLLNNQLNNKLEKPKFVYAHLMLPHWPFYKDSIGNYNKDEIIIESSFQNDKSLFLAYVKYTNTVMKSIVESITTKDSNGIIIIMSDHGFRSYQSKEPFEPFCFDNLCTVRLPKDTLQNYKGSWSSVNFFRSLLNTSFGQALPYLKDRTIWISF